MVFPDFDFGFCGFHKQAAAQIETFCFSYYCFSYMIVGIYAWQLLEARESVLDFVSSQLVLFQITEWLALFRSQPR